ncbi:pyridoxine/pyridoxal/pyridoxamine kinase [Acidovorax sp. SDU_ACID1]|uniref:pyridoxine/pyridoxal/pyridoxamine kinase n=1 Tax=Acidovorax sp. SDU_ACID1 TaxID=3136632 RepID=UPI00387376C1
MTESFDPSRTGHQPPLQPLPIDVVSIQSQVVYGRVGNSLAVPVLHAHGLNVAAVPTVLFSNTPHYPTLHGGPLPVEWFAGYLEDLKARGALRQLRAILVGYLGSPEQATVLSQWIDEVRVERPELRVIVDPVIGDHDHGVYVAPGLADACRQLLLPRAYGLTPNGFELEYLTRHAAGSLEDVVVAARNVLVGQLQWVVVTSAAPDAWAPGEMQIAIITRDEARTIRHPRIEASPKGTGDLFSAELCAHLLAGFPLFEAAERACRRTVAVVDRTNMVRSAELLLPQPLHISQTN